MAGFFYLESLTNDNNKTQQAEDRRNDGRVVRDNNNHLFLHRPSDSASADHEIYAATNKGFELWPARAFGLGLSNGDVLERRVAGGGRSCDAIASRSGAVLMRSSGSGGGGGGGGGMNCQDCGNQAKKDCVHMRCRTCCKSRGFQCPTHVKSTWVPAARRRERQQQFSALQQQQQQQHPHAQFRLENPKRPRESHQPGTSLACTVRAGLEVGGQFPAEVSSPAVFRCVRVSSMDETGDDEFAYQTSVNIGGHVFKGVLYDQGPDTAFSSGGGGAGAGIPLLGHLAMGGGASSSAATATSAGSNPAVAVAAAAMLDPSLYPAPLNAFMAGTQFFPPPRS